MTVLQAAGADLDASGDPTKLAETPLHWAASNDDVELVDALLDAGADVNVPGSIINGLGPVADAAVFGGIRAGRRLVERGAVTNIFQAAALGFIDRVRSELATEPGPDAERITAAFWAACGSGQRDIAELLLAHGAEINWLGWGDQTALDQAPKRRRRRPGRMARIPRRYIGCPAHRQNRSVANSTRRSTPSFRRV